jgi:hypothetical protein
MPRVHFVKKARKTKRRYGIKKGKPYYWWRRRRPGAKCGYTCYSVTPPKPSQLTGSEFLSTVYGIQEGLEEMAVDSKEAAEEFAQALRDAAEELRNLGSEQEEKAGNMPESLQESPTAELLRERATACEDMADKLETAAGEVDEHTADWQDPDESEDEDKEEDDEELEVPNSRDEVEGIRDGLDFGEFS